MTSNPFSNEAPAFVFKPVRTSKEKKISSSAAAETAAAVGLQISSDAVKDVPKGSVSPPPLKRKRKGEDPIKSSSNPSRRNSETSSSPPANSNKKTKTSASEAANVGDDLLSPGHPEPILPRPPSPSERGGDIMAPTLVNLNSEIPVSSSTAETNAADTSTVPSGILVPSNKGIPPKTGSRKPALSGSRVSFSFERDPEKPLTKNREKCKELFDLIGSASSRRTPLSSTERKDLSSSIALYHIRTGAMVHRLLLDSEDKLSNARRDSEKVDVLKEGLWKAQEDLVKAKKESVEALERYQAAIREVGVLSEEVGRLKGELRGACLEKEELSLLIAKLGEDQEVLRARLSEGNGDGMGKFGQITTYVRGRGLVDPVIDFCVQVEAQVQPSTILRRRGVRIPRTIIKELEVEASELFREFGSFPDGSLLLGNNMFSSFLSSNFGFAVGCKNFAFNVFFFNILLLCRNYHWECGS